MCEHNGGESTPKTRLLMGCTVQSAGGRRSVCGRAEDARLLVRLGATSSHPVVYTPAPSTQEATERPNTPLTQQEVCKPQNSACAIVAGENIFLNHNKIVSKGKSHVYAALVRK